MSFVEHPNDTQYQQTYQAMEQEIIDIEKEMAQCKKTLNELMTRHEKLRTMVVPLRQVYGDNPEPRPEPEEDRSVFRNPPIH